MGKYDHVFDSEETSTQSLNPEEAVAAIAVITVLSDSEVSDVDTDTIASLLWELEVFAEYSEDNMSEMVDELIGIAEEEGLGALFNTTYESLSDELLPDAFAAGVMMVVDDYGVIPAEQRRFLKELQQALELEDKEAQQIVNEVLTAFNEAAEEEDLDAEEAEVDEEESSHAK